MRVRAAALCSFLLSIAGAAQAADFDFYVLALSWSPAWCASAQARPDSAQCAKDSGLGFVVHGLWPQYETGYPEYCASARVPEPVVDSVLDIMPDRRLVEHEWRKHGTCSESPAADYFATTRAAFERVTVPAEFENVAENRTASAAAIEAAFAAANPGLPADGIAIVCSDGWFREVRVCLERSLAFRSCEEVDTQGCRQKSLRVIAAD